MLGLECYAKKYIYIYDVRHLLQAPSNCETLSNIINMSEPNNKTCPFSPDIAAAACGPCPLNGSGGQYDHRVAAMNNV